MSVWFRFASIGICLLFTVSSQAVEFHVTLKGSNLASKQVPIRAAVDMDKSESTTVSLSGDGYNLLGQLAPASLNSPNEGMELTFVMPTIEANAEIKLVGMTIPSSETKTRFHFHDESGKHRELKIGDRPVMRYMYEAIDRSSKKRIGETYKVFHHVYDPSGSRYVTKGPGGLFPHHRGLFFGFNRISYDGKKADVWHCKNGERQNHREFAAEEAGATFGREVLKIDWHGQDDQVFAAETREMTAYNVQGGILIDFASLLESQVGKIRLDGDPQHAGFQFRASQHVPDNTKAQTFYVRPDGKGKPGEFRNWSNKENETPQNLAHIDLAWNALCFVIDGQAFTCCYLDSPKNPKPARFSERDYGRFGSYFEYDMDSDKTLELNYRVWLQTGEMTVDEINHISQGFVSPPQVSIEVVGR